MLEVEIFRAEKLKLPKTDTGDGGIGDALFAVLDFAGGSVPDKPPQDELYCVLRAGGKRARTLPTAPTDVGEWVWTAAHGNKLRMQHNALQYQSSYQRCLIDNNIPPYSLVDAGGDGLALTALR